MKDWKDFYEDSLSRFPDLNAADKERIFEEYRVYPDSVQKSGNSYFYMARDDKEKFLIVTGDALKKYPFQGEQLDVHGTQVKKCPLVNENCNVIRKIFDFTNPSPNVRNEISIGFGDRLGVASAGHIRLVKDLPVYPVLAQQSRRELKLTGRTFADVISDAAWAVFQEGYTRGYGADGDHLKDREAVEITLENNVTMITLDCIEHLWNGVEDASLPVIMSRYSAIDQAARSRLEANYLNKTHALPDGTKFSFTAENFYKIVTVYYDVIGFAGEIYREFIVPHRSPIDFELSIDETTVPTSPEAHFFVANELKSAGVKITSLAPRFCGEFQKGIDYKGDAGRFEKEYILHEKIAEAFGYKLSIHSGSDKFTVFPIIGKHSKKYLLKTAGTSWLEAVKLISEKNPSLYRRMHKFALKHFDEMKQYYIVTTDLSKVPDIDGYADSLLPSLMSMDDARQLMHLTYGLILQAKNPDGASMFRTEIFQTLFSYEDEYYKALEKHLGRHLEKLQIIFR